MEITPTARKEHLTMIEACHRCSVSWKTYYRRKNRLREEGIDRLKNRSRRPGLSPRKTEAQTEFETVRIKAVPSIHIECVPVAISEEHGAWQYLLGWCTTFLW
ncbi:MAG: helix-turn-helix domain-containing protein [Theionarchaea archaeon]|nr:helix-turn-helix domain-containing protein [Theionarchaea archaeon]